MDKFSTVDVSNSPEDWYDFWYNSSDIFEEELTVKKGEFSTDSNMNCGEIR